LKTAQDAPRILKAGRPRRHDSFFSRTCARPNSFAMSGREMSGVTAYSGRVRWKGSTAGLRPGPLYVHEAAEGLWYMIGCKRDDSSPKNGGVVEYRCFIGD
jgi:hypothetical protein